MQISQKNSPVNHVILFGKIQDSICPTGNKETFANHYATILYALRAMEHKT
jgi:hypothetical protein